MAKRSFDLSTKKMIRGMQFKVPKARGPLTTISVKSVGEASTLYHFSPKKCKTECL